MLRGGGGLPSHQASATPRKRGLSAWMSLGLGLAGQNATQLKVTRSLAAIVAWKVADVVL